MFELCESRVHILFEGDKGWMAYHGPQRQIFLVAAFCVRSGFGLAAMDGNFYRQLVPIANFNHHVSTTRLTGVSLLHFKSGFSQDLSNNLFTEISARK